MHSTDSKLYPGVKVPYERKVVVYIPKQNMPGIVELLANQHIWPQ